MRENSKSDKDKFKFEKTYTRRHETPIESFQIYETKFSNTFMESPSTSSGSSSSDMNILQELEAQGILNSSTLTSSSKDNETVNECNLIDLSSDGSCDNIAKFNQLTLNNEKTMNNSKKIDKDPFGSSELLSDVMSELYKTNKNNWTTFE